MNINEPSLEDLDIKDFVAYLTHEADITNDMHLRTALDFVKTICNAVDFTIQQAKQRGD